MKRLKLLSCAALAIIASSCSISKTITLIPTSGKLASQGITSIPAKFSWNGSGSGNVEVYMPDGEVCKGKYSTIAQGSRSYSSGQSHSSYRTSGLYPNDFGISGSGSYSGSSRRYQNEQHGKAIVTGGKGRVLTIFYTTSMNNPTSGHGDGFDNKGNRYTIVF